MLPQYAEQPMLTEKTVSQGNGPNACALEFAPAPLAMVVGEGVVAADEPFALQIAMQSTSCSAVAQRARRGEGKVDRRNRLCVDVELQSPRRVCHATHQQVLRIGVLSPFGRAFARGSAAPA
jgi:hypothetical protein